MSQSRPTDAWESTFQILFGLDEEERTLGHQITSVCLHIRNYIKKTKTKKKLKIMALSILWHISILFDFSFSFS